MLEPSLVLKEIRRHDEKWNEEGGGALRARPHKAMLPTCKKERAEEFSAKKQQQRKISANVT